MGQSAHQAACPADWATGGGVSKGHVPCLAWDVAAADSREQSVELADPGAVLVR
jgi:hypothetical protein